MSLGQKPVDMSSIRTEGNMPPALSKGGKSRTREIGFAMSKVSDSSLDKLGSLPNEQINLVIAKIAEKSRIKTGEATADVVPPGLYTLNNRGVVILPSCFGEDNPITAIIVACAKELNYTIKTATYAADLLEKENLSPTTEKVLWGVAMSICHNSKVILNRNKHDYLLGLALGFAQRVKGEFIHAGKSYDEDWSHMLKKNNYFYGNNPGESVTYKSADKKEHKQNIQYSWPSFLAMSVKGLWSLHLMEMITRLFHKLRLSTFTGPIDDVITDNIIPFGDFVHRFGYWTKTYDKKSKSYVRNERKMPELPSASSLFLPRELKLIRSLGKYLWDNLSEVQTRWSDILVADGPATVSSNLSAVYMRRQGFLESFANLTTARLREVRTSSRTKLTSKSDVTRDNLVNSLRSREDRLLPKAIEELLSLLPVTVRSYACQVAFKLDHAPSRTEYMAYLSRELILVYNDDVLLENKLPAASTPEPSEDEAVISTQKSAKEMIELKRLCVIAKANIRAFIIKPSETKITTASNTLKNCVLKFKNIEFRRANLNKMVAKIMLEPHFGNLDPDEVETTLKTDFQQTVQLVALTKWKDHNFAQPASWIEVIGLVPQLGLPAIQLDTPASLKKVEKKLGKKPAYAPPIEEDQPKPEA